MSDTIMIISTFEKAEEMEKFFQSIEQSDLSEVPKAIIINTDPDRSKTGESNVRIAKYFKKKNDRIFVSRKNYYMSSYRYIIQKYFQEFEYFLGTEVDFWFEQPFLFYPHIKYFQQHSEVGLITILARYHTIFCNTYFDKMTFNLVDDYMEIANKGGIRPWHLCFTKMRYVLDFFDDTKCEIADSLFADYIKNRVGKRVLTVDCRKHAVHFDYHATVKKYPYYAELCGVKHFSTQQRSVEDQDIIEI